MWESVGEKCGKAFWGVEVGGDVGVEGDVGKCGGRCEKVCLGVGEERGDVGGCGKCWGRCGKVCGGGKGRRRNRCGGRALSAHSPSERMCWIVRGCEERCGERCGKMCCGVRDMRGGGGE